LKLTDKHSLFDHNERTILDVEATSLLRASEGSRGKFMGNQKLTRIYVVDDERVIAETLAKILDGNGFSATSFIDPLQALSAAKITPPDLVISDVIMPQLSGVELAIQIREHCPSCKILLFSGNAATVDLLADARKRGHDFHLLKKPIHPNELLRQIRNQDIIQEHRSDVALMSAE
jgi:CheY-like chemotaxis protein